MSKVSIAAKILRQPGRSLILATSIITMLLLAGCISSSKVYNNDKTVVYNGSIYNMANVKQVATSITGKLKDDTVVNLKGSDKKKIENYIKQNGTVYVRMAFTMDDQEMLYRSKEIDSYSDYKRMNSAFEKAGNQISSLMGSKKKRQLKLK